MAYGNDVNLIGDDVNRIEIHRPTDVLLYSCKDIALAVNITKAKYMEIRRWGMMANGNITIDSNSYEEVKIFKYLGSLLTNKYSNLEEVKCRLKAGNLC